MKKSNVDFESIKFVLQGICASIEKAIGEDTKEYLTSYNNETNNAVKHIRGDRINTNLRNTVVSNTIELHPFRRRSFDGRLLIDRKNKLTYTICKKQTLLDIPRNKDRTIPHYLQSILSIQNSNVEAEYTQMTLAGFTPTCDFAHEVYLEDYKDIMGEDISFDDEYLHIVVVYEAYKYKITYIAAEVLTPDFNIGQMHNMMYLIQPDFMDLTSESESEFEKKDAHSLVAVKPSLVKKKLPKQEPLVSAKKEEEEKQA